MDRIFDTFAVHIAAYFVDQADVAEDAGRVSRLLGGRMHMQSGVAFPLFVQDAQNIDGCAAAECHEDGFHRCGAGFFRDIESYRVA